MLLVRLDRFDREIVQGARVREKVGGVKEGEGEKNVRSGRSMVERVVRRCMRGGVVAVELEKWKRKKVCAGEKEGMMEIVGVTGMKEVGVTEVLVSDDSRSYVDLVTGNRQGKESHTTVGVQLKVLLRKYRSDGDYLVWAGNGFEVVVIKGESSPLV